MMRVFAVVGTMLLLATPVVARAQDDKTVDRPLATLPSPINEIEL